MFIIKEKENILSVKGKYFVFEDTDFTEETFLYRTAFSSPQEVLEYCNHENELSGAEFKIIYGAEHTLHQTRTEWEILKCDVTGEFYRLKKD